MSIIQKLTKAIEYCPLTLLLTKLFNSSPYLKEMVDYLKDLFLQGISNNTAKYLFLMGFAPMTYRLLRFITVQSYMSFIALRHVHNQHKLTQQNMKQKYGDCWAVVTGCSDGIGWALVEELAAMNFKLLLVVRNNSKLKKKLDVLLEKYDSVDVLYEPLQTDLSDLTQTKQLINTLEKFAQERNIGIFINNAGVADARGEMFIHRDIKTQIQILNTNMYSSIMLTKTMTNIFQHSKTTQVRSIVNVSSIGAQFPFKYAGVYPFAKRILSDFTLSLGLQLKQKQEQTIELCCVEPSLVSTKMVGMKKGPISITPTTCARSILADMLQGNKQTNSGLPHKIAALYLSLMTQKQVLAQFQKIFNLKKDNP